jgi:3',5'-cyclic AMP phosphodiesterase CpdA
MAPARGTSSERRFQEIPMSRVLKCFPAAALVAALFLAWPAQADVARAADGRFTIAVIPDTQNYLDYKHQRAAGFPIDAAEMFFDQVGFIARNLKSEGGEIAFVTHVGDVWQHATGGIDAAHLALGLREDPENIVVGYYAPDPRALTVEARGADLAFRKLAGRVPLSVVPGNHDYDGFWADSRFSGGRDPRDPSREGSPYGMLHYGGLDNFNSVFGERSVLFAERPWRVGSHNGGANSATVFEAAGYRFLHLGLEFAPHDDVLRWAADTIRRYPGLPTLVTIHDHLNNRGERKPNPVVDMKAVHPEHNNPEDVWQKFLSRHRQVFLVLSGHQHGQARRVDAGAEGGKVWQLLADYQDRNQALRHVVGDGKMPGTLAAAGLGDGWMRLLKFDLTGPGARLQVRTYSTHFKAYASDLPDYARWYRSLEKPELSDPDFLAEDEFTLELDDFYQRFGKPKKVSSPGPIADR